MKTRTGPLFFFSSLTPSSFPAVLPPLWALAVPKAQGRSQCVTAAKASIWTCWYAPPPPPHLSYLHKLPGDLHDLRGGGSSESRSDDEMRIIFSRSLWVHPWAAFKSVLICETNSEVSLTSSWPAGRGVAGRSPPRDCAFLSLSCNNVCQTGVVPICQPDSHHKNSIYASTSVITDTISVSWDLRLTHDWLSRGFCLIRPITDWIIEEKCKYAKRPDPRDACQLKVLNCPFFAHTCMWHIVCP